MDTITLISRLIAREKTAADFVVGLVSDDDAFEIAAHQYSESPAEFTNDASGRKKLADETFGAIRHFLRGKIGTAVDIAFHIADVRTPLRKKANDAAAKEMDAVNS